MDKDLFNGTGEELESWWKDVCEYEEGIRKQISRDNKIKDLLKK